MPSVNQLILLLKDSLIFLSENYSLYSFPMISDKSVNAAVVSLLDKIFSHDTSAIFLGN